MDLESQETTAENEGETSEGAAENQEPARIETQQPNRTVFDSDSSVTADVWKEIVSVGIEEDGKERGRCIHCCKKFVINKHNGTSSLRRHLLSHCSKKLKNQSRSNDGASVSESSGDREGASNILSKKRQRSSVSEGTTSSALLRRLDVLDCPVCFEALTIPIFQCDNGHLACSSCCPKLSNKCPACASPIGHNRCRAMESVLESVFVPCPNAKLGCTESCDNGHLVCSSCCPKLRNKCPSCALPVGNIRNRAMETVVESIFVPCRNAEFGCKWEFPYGKESTHEKQCNFSPCSCPVQDCDYSGSVYDINDHFSDHKEIWLSNSVQMNISDKIQISIEASTTLLFPVQCFREPCGVYVTVSCIAPPASVVGKFKYHISYTTADGHTVVYKSPEVKRILEVSYEIPQDNFMLIPHNLLRGESLELNLCISELKQV